MIIRGKGTSFFIRNKQVDTNRAQNKELPIQSRTCSLTYFNLFYTQIIHFASYILFSSQLHTVSLTYG